MFLESLLILFLKVIHVFGNVSAEDVFLVHFGVELSIAESGESLWRVGNVQTSISGAFQNTENTGSG